MVKGAKEPKNFTEFFDVKAFPGKRCLPDFPHYCLPFALQAAGVPIDKMFPLDVDLAFKKLNEIKAVPESLAPLLKVVSSR